MVAAVCAVSACGRGGEPRLLSPGDRSLVLGGVPVEVAVESDAYRVAIEVDGVPVTELVSHQSGIFRGYLPPLERGAHEVTAYLPDAAGVVATSRVYVDRLALAPVDGWGFSEDASSVVALSKRRTADDGLAVGRLERTAIDGSAAAGEWLTDDGAFAEVTASHVAWMEDWKGGAGTLRVAGVGDAAGASIHPGVREMRFTRDGTRLVALDDDGLLQFEDAFEDPRRIIARADAFAFAGPLDEVVSFAATAGTSYTATFVDATGRITASLAEVRLGVARNPARREVALFEAGATPSLLVWDFASSTLTEEVARAAGAEYSRDGSWLAAIVQVGTTGGTLALSRRGPAGAFDAVAGTFVSAAFDAESSHLYGRAYDGTLVDVTLGDPLVTAAVAADVVDFAPLAGGALAWYDSTAALHVRRPDGVIVPVGALRTSYPEVTLAADGARLAFTTQDGTRQPVRVVDVAAGTWHDFGEDARGLTFLGDALAWLERRADEEEGGLANFDLWLLPELPIFGPSRVAQRVKSDASLPKSFAEDRLAVLADLPRRGEPWNARALCVRADGEVRELGAADAKMRFVFFLPDGRIARFGPDGKEKQVLFFDRCDG